jgi:hypothetical protein
MAPWDNGYVSCYNTREREPIRYDLPHPVDLWREMLRYVIGRIWFLGEWSWIYKYIRISLYGVMVHAKLCEIIPFFILKLAHGRGRHWDRKRRK